MKYFWKKANKYVKDNLDKIDKLKNFIFENSEIQPELLIELLKMKDQFDYYSEAYEKEYDYNRLLRIENEQLSSMIDELQSELLDTDAETCIDIKKKGGTLVS